MKNTYQCNHCGSKSIRVSKWSIMDIGTYSCITCGETADSAYGILKNGYKIKYPKALSGFARE